MKQTFASAKLARPAKTTPYLSPNVEVEPERFWSCTLQIPFRFCMPFQALCQNACLLFMLFLDSVDQESRMLHSATGIGEAISVGRVVSDSFIVFHTSNPATY